jgi:hypothetical protein
MTGQIDAIFFDMGGTLRTRLADKGQLTIILREPEDAPADPTWATLVPDHMIHRLSELLTIFPPRRPAD